MDIRGLLDQVMQSGRDLTSQGQEMAERKLGIPEQGPERDTMLSGMGKGAAVAGVLGLLLGTRTGRSVAGTGLKLGGLAALGGLAYKAYQDWQGKQTGAPPPPPGTPVGELTGSAAEDRSRALLKAMIAAAKADGHIDESERAKIDEYIKKIELDNDTLHFIKTEISKPLDVDDIAAGADSPESAAEIYLMSLMAIDVDNVMERHYLERLAGRLGLAPELVAHLEHQVTS